MKYPERLHEITGWLRSACDASGAKKLISNKAILKRLSEEYEKPIMALSHDAMKHLKDVIEEDGTFKTMKRLHDFEDYVDEARARAQGKHTASMKKMASPKERRTLVASWMRTASMNHGGKGVRHDVIVRWLEPFTKVIATLSNDEFQRLHQGIMKDRTYMVRERVAALPAMIEWLKTS